MGRDDFDFEAVLASAEAQVGEVTGDHFAAMLGTNPSTVSRWKHRQRTPARSLRRMLRMLMEHPELWRILDREARDEEEARITARLDELARLREQEDG